MVLFVYPAKTTSDRTDATHRKSSGHSSATSKTDDIAAKMKKFEERVKVS